MKTRGLLICLLICFGFVLWGSCGIFADSASEFLVSEESAGAVSLGAGTTFYVGQKIKFQKSTGATYRSSNSSIASVTASGIVTFKKAGNVTIYVTIRSTGRTKAHQFKVLACSIKLNKSSVSLKVGGSSTLKATVKGPNNTVSWSSGNKSVAAVSSSGKVTAKKTGTAVIYAKANGKTARCTVKVTGTSVRTYGYVENCLNGSGLGGATVAFRKGSSNTSGTVYKKAVTNSSGYYSVNLAKGSYTVTVTKSGYITTSFNYSCTKNQRYDVAISAPVASFTCRIVLTWDNTTDLDAHLNLVPSSGASRYHVYFGNKKGYLNNNLVVSMDLDKTSYGPETITFDYTNMMSGTFTYTVHDYSSRNYSLSSALASSGAKVVLYNGTRQVNSYSVPKQNGTYWRVFEIIGTTVYVRNVMGYQSSPSSITSGGSR